MHENPYEAPHADLSALPAPSAPAPLAIDAAVIDALGELTPWLRRLQIVCWCAVAGAGSISLAFAMAALLDKLPWSEKAQGLMIGRGVAAILSAFPARSVGRAHAQLVKLEEARNLPALTAAFDALRSAWKVAALALWLWLGTFLLERVLLVLDAAVTP